MASKVELCVEAILLVVLCDHASGKKVYIVQMKSPNKPVPYTTQKDWYMASLSSVSSSRDAGDDDINLLYTYNLAYQGYAAALEPEQVEALRKHSHVLGVYEDVLLKIHTTHTPKFLKINDELGLWKAPGNASKGINTGAQRLYDVIIGMLDTGIHPESKSFDDTGYPEIPKRWRGICEAGPDFSPALCNKKLIGARYFAKGYIHEGGNITTVLSPRDHEGHGTHTASTAAGSPVKDAKFLENVMGTARGMAPHARLATYKVCWGDCMSSDILAGMDQAISDGVDIMSLSLGGFDFSYSSNVIIVGAFAAMEKGIFVSASAGNNGPSPGSLSNGAPWIMTVGASTVDRDFPGFVTLGNGQRFTGFSKYGGAPLKGMFELVYLNKGMNGSNLCLAGTLDPVAVQGKVVLCDRGENARMEKGLAVRDAGGVGLILTNTKSSDQDLYSDPSFIPAVMVPTEVGNKIKKYITKSNHRAKVRLTFTPFRLNVRPAPQVADFSSRGPYFPVMEIIKPDVIAPGVDIVASWTYTPPSEDIPQDTRRVEFNIISGTSMSCPHVTGIAALLKAAHPNWSVSAIKSALMTTAYIHDNTGRPISDASNSSAGYVPGPYVIGSGHVNPRKALNPGLVYDIGVEDYAAFVCTLGLKPEEVQMILRNRSLVCSRKLTSLGELNYPSFTASLNKNHTVVSYTRELTNVGAPGSVYRVKVVAPPNTKVTVHPKRLVFGAVGDKKRYTATFIGNGPNIDGSFGSITWRKGQHKVRSPFIFRWL